VRRRIRALREYGNSTVKMKWVLPAYLLIFVIACGMFVANITYSRERADQSELIATQATYEQCVRRVESRTEIRGMFEATFEAVEELAGSRADATFDRVRIRLDERYPAITLADAGCVDPTPPTTEN
jgi:hypothetical protein